jgi:hypothetical protein
MKRMIDFADKNNLEIVLAYYPPCMIKFKINIGQRDQVSFNSLLGGRLRLRTGFSRACS